MRWVVQHQDSEVLAVHAALLHTGQVLYFSGSQHDQPPHAPPLSGAEQVAYLDHTRLWDPATGSVRRIPSPAPIYDTFCCGHAFLADGTLLIAGGTSGYPPPRPPGQQPPPHFDHFQGLRNAAMFVPELIAQGTPWWNVAPMATEPLREAHRFLDTGGGRWYPTLLTLSDGSVLAVGGHPASDDSRHSNTMVEVFHRFPTPAGTWGDAGDVPAEVALEADHRQTPETYPRGHLLPDGDVFFVRLIGGRSWRWSPPTARWAPVTPGEALPPLVEGTDPLGYVQADFARYNRTLFAWTSALLPLLPEEGWRARIVVAGRAQPFVIDTTASPSQWRPTGPRDRANPGLFNPARNRPAQGDPAAPDYVPGSQSGMRQGVLPVLLPDATVLFVGGSSTEPWNSAGLDVLRPDAIFVPEVYDPARDAWSSLPAAATVARVYHAVALLLPDGRVWTAGSNHDSGLGDANRELRIEVFEPWYLDRPRPDLLSAPQGVHHGEEFGVTVRQAASIRRAAVIRAGSVTHGFNGDQRYVGLTFRRIADDRLLVEAPPNGNIGPPGYYLLFVSDADGVPSAGLPLRIGAPPSAVGAISSVPRGTGLFTHGLDGQIWSTFFDPRQTSPAWVDWFPIGPDTFPASSEAIALTSHPGGSSLFALDQNGHVRSTFFDPDHPGPAERGGWRDWFSIRENQFPKGAGITALSTVEGGSSLFTTGFDGQIWGTFFEPRAADRGWAEWFPIGPNVFHPSVRVTAISTVPRGTSLFVGGIDGRVWSTFFDPDHPGPPERRGWRPWFPIKENTFPVGTPIGAASTVQGGVNLFTGGRDGQVWSTFFDPQQPSPAWVDWFPIGPNVFPTGSSIAAVSPRPRAVSLFVLGFDGQIWSSFFDPDHVGSPERGGWQPWFPIGPNVFPGRSRISAISTVRGGISLFVTGFDGRVWTSFFDPDHPGPAERGGWVQWGPIHDNVFPHG
jgi:hypothetical protein